VARGFEAVSTVAIDAPKAKVWDALTDPAKVKLYMHGTDLTTDWRSAARSPGRASGRASPTWTRAPSSRSTPRRA
jgi:uncharacterized protein YndB with AHSA1/START domain